MYTEEQLRDTWSEAISHAEDRLSGNYPVFKTFDEWKESLVKESDSLPNVRLSCFQEVWQKWCESKSTQEFDEWLHAQMHEA